MANDAHLKTLKEGQDAWNVWRSENPAIRPDLRESNLTAEDLSVWDLSRVDLSGADLSRAILSTADLSTAILIGANLSETKLSKANLSKANLSGANLSGANLLEANLSGADLSGADLSGADLSEANLSNANLSWTDLSGAILFEADLSGATFFLTHLKRIDLNHSRMSWTLICKVDLSEARGLETVGHSGPSTIGIDSIFLSKGKIPEIFLRGAGVPEEFITYMKSLVANPIEYYSCFISYSSKDEEFARRLHADLQAVHVRCWFAPEDLKIGERFRPRIDEAIRLHDKLLLVLSQNSVSSPWVETEVESAFERERKEGRTVLFPIRLDNGVMETDEAWAADIRRKRHIGNFSQWRVKRQRI
jgi:uncharacterized protein YjbI with pentapeptide repeats